MIPKLLTAFLSAAILSAVLGTMPCEATSAKHRVQGKPPAASADPGAARAADLNSPATDFSSVKPVVDNPHPDLIPPRRNRNEFFNQTQR